MEPASDHSLGLDVYLFPAVVGGGLGDVAEVRDAGRSLTEAGFPPILFRIDDRPLPPVVDRILEGLQVRKVRVPLRQAARALTVAPMWGVSAAPARRAPYGRAGIWAEEAGALERSYGADGVVHVSLEEFARHLTSREETIERYREGGMAISEIRRRIASPQGHREIAEFHAAYRLHRALDRPNVLHLYQTFRTSPKFRREYPETVQCAPIWPERWARPSGSARRVGRTWVWYASPSTSARLAPAVLRGLSGVEPPIDLGVRAGRSEGWPAVPGGVRTDPIPTEEWRREFASAEMRIVTGSRTLLEALALGLPFLYFNGTLGSGRSSHRHRPEKIRSLLAAWRDRRVRTAILGDLDAFSRGRRVAAVVRRAATDPRFRRAFRSAGRPVGFDPPWDDGRRLLIRLARDWASGSEDAPRLVARYRRSGPSTPVPRRHAR